VAATEHVPDKLLAEMAIALADKMIMAVLPAPYCVNPEKAAETLCQRFSSF
jgi:hypothetical protein